jgi:mono/diheme cytochrome c family protein
MCSGCSWLGGPGKSHEQQVAEGRALYEANGCATCHGAEGRGDGPVAKMSHSAARDFRDAGAFVNGATVGQIAGTIATGLTRGNQIMPPYRHLSIEERELLAVFVVSLRGDAHKENNGNENK